jgi:hypothetical protein
MPFVRYVEKYGGAKEATYDDTVWLINVTRWISKVIRTYAHAYAHAPGCSHACARTHAHTLSPWLIGIQVVITHKNFDLEQQA